MSICKKYAFMPTEQLLDIYTDLGAMGTEMDCTKTEWDAICAEIERREPIIFHYMTIELEYGEDGSVYPIVVDLSRYEAASQVHSIEIRYEAHHELPYIPGVFLSCRWDEERKTLVYIKPLEVEELPF